MRQYPFVTVDAEAIAQGLVAMLDENQIAGLRFGLLPAEVMQSLEEAVTGRFKTALAITYMADNGDCEIAVERNAESEKIADSVLAETCFIKFNFKELVSDTIREITLKMYDQVEMVV